ncbi:hypothetical protein [Mucilaginibacter sp. HD30]
MKKTLSISFIIVLMACGCKKNNESPDTGSKNSYQPVSRESFWKYKEIGPSGTPLTTLVTMTGATKTINGHMYYEYTTQLAPSGAKGTGYSYSENGIVRSAIGDVENLFLKENAAIGETWTYMGPMADKEEIRPGVFVDSYSTVIAKVVEKGINYTVEGKAFANVIHIKQMKQYSSGATIDLDDYYIAKGVGMIERKSADGTNGSLLVDYAVK